MKYWDINLLTCLIYADFYEICLQHILFSSSSKLWDTSNVFEGQTAVHVLKTPTE